MKRRKKTTAQLRKATRERVRAWRAKKKAEASTPAVRERRGCSGCGEELSGRKRKFHSEACRKRAARGASTPNHDELSALPAETPTDPAQAVADWSRDCLIVPPGHPKAGEPMELPDYGVAFLRDVFTHSESLLCVGRKNSKSGIVAVLLLAHLAGPLRRHGFRAGVCSLSKDKAAELKKQMEQIAAASKLDGLTFRRSPAPGNVEGEYGEVDILSSESDAGAASGFDLSLIDELGLFDERDRDLVGGMRSAVSARNGRFVSLSIHGDGPFIPEILERHKQGDPTLAVHLYQSPEGCALDDRAAWEASNPGLKAGIKSYEYMAAQARRVAITTSDQRLFRSHDLNIPGNPSKEPLLSAHDWEACQVPQLPDRKGPCVVGFDAGSSLSLTCATPYWPLSRRFEFYGALPDTPPIEEREEFDGQPYRAMIERGELRLFSGRVTPVGRFLEDLTERLRGERVIAFGCDRHRKAEVLQAFEAAKLDPRLIQWRGVGAHAVADGSHDVRAFQRAVVSKRLAHSGSIMMAAAIRECTVRTDGAGNPALEKTNRTSRIDAAQAAVIACGLAEIHTKEIMRPRRPMRFAVVDP